MPSLLQRMRGLLSRTVTGESLASILFRDRGVSGRMHVEGMERPAETVLWIYLGMMARADSVSSVPLRVTRGDDQVVESGPLVDLLAQPNGAMDGVQYLHLIECHLAIYNRALVAMVSTAETGRPNELVPLPPQHCTPRLGVHQPTGIKYPLGWEYRDPGTGAMTWFPREMVIPIFSYSPHDMGSAVNPMAVGRRAMLGHVSAQEQNLAIFKNGGMPDVVFESDQRWTRDQAEEFLAQWQARYGGTINAHKPGVLYGGLKAKALGLSPAELQFLEGLRYTREELIALMRVKPAMVGLMTGETGLSQGTSTAEQKVAWWNETGLYELARIAAAHQQFLVDRWGWTTGRERARSLTRSETFARRDAVARVTGRGAAGVGLQVWFDEGSIEELSEHRLGKVETLAKLLELGWRPDDAVEALDLRLPPHPTNAATIPMGRQLAEDVIAVGMRDAGDGMRDEPPPPEPARAAPPADAAQLVRACDHLGETLRRARWDGVRGDFDRVVEEEVRQYARRMARYWIEQRGRVLARYRKATEGPDALERGATLQRGLGDAILAVIFPRPEEDGLLRARIVPVLQRLVRRGWDLLTAQVGEQAAGDNPFQVEDPRIAAAIEARAVQAIKANDTTQAAIVRIVQQGIAEGISTTEIGDQLAAYYKGTAAEKAARAQTAARTQVAGSVNDGLMTRAQKVGGLWKAWLHGNPQEAREHHLEADSRYQAAPIPLDVPFRLANGVSMMQPGDASAPIGEVANCTCTVVFVPAGETA